MNLVCLSQRDSLKGVSLVSFTAAARGNNEETGMQRLAKFKLQLSLLLMWIHPGTAHRLAADSSSLALKTLSGLHAQLDTLQIAGDRHTKGLTGCLAE